MQPPMPPPPPSQFDHLYRQTVGLGDQLVLRQAQDAPRFESAGQPLTNRDFEQLLHGHPSNASALPLEHLIRHQHQEEQQQQVLFYLSCASKNNSVKCLLFFCLYAVCAAGTVGFRKNTLLEKSGVRGLLSFMPFQVLLFTASVWFLLIYLTVCTFLSELKMS